MKQIESIQAYEDEYHKSIEDPEGFWADIAADKVTASRVLLEKMGRGDFSKLHEIYGPGFVAHAGGKRFSLEEDNASGRAIRSAVPDLQVIVDHLIGEGDLVAVRWRAKGTRSVLSGAPNGKRQ